MKLEDYLEGLYRLGMAVGDHWFESHDPLAYRLAESCSRSGGRCSGNSSEDAGASLQMKLTQVSQVSLAL
jgi:hypothetical protein